MKSRYLLGAGAALAVAFGCAEANALIGRDKERITKIFHALAEGGQLKGPLAKRPSGAEVGYLLDKFGINWVVTIEKA